MASVNIHCPRCQSTKTGGVLAYTFGPRTDETCRELLALLTPFNIGMIW
ncbi:Transposase [Shigella dysenteriae 1617]|uniref:Transposase n=1 Tax=Shigella dysenteriae 1617 TaxID=754093 RepID=A0A0A6ZM97_SHIDY|nr:Transposase [Shigella dysenteriae 1617]